MPRNVVQVVKLFQYARQAFAQTGKGGGSEKVQLSQVQ